MLLPKLDRALFRALLTFTTLITVSCGSGGDQEGQFFTGTISLASPDIGRGAIVSSPPPTGLAAAQVTCSKIPDPVNAKVSGRNITYRLPIICEHEPITASRIELELDYRMVTLNNGGEYKNELGDKWILRDNYFYREAKYSIVRDVTVDVVTTIEKELPFKHDEDLDCREPTISSAKPLGNEEVPKEIEVVLTTPVASQERGFHARTRSPIRG